MHLFNSSSPLSVSFIYSPSFIIILCIIPSSSSSFNFLDTVCCDKPDSFEISVCVTNLSLFNNLNSLHVNSVSFQVSPSVQPSSASLYSPFISSSMSLVAQFQLSVQALPICIGLSNLLNKTILLGICSDRIL